MYNTWGGSFGRNGSKQWFSPKKWSKNTNFGGHGPGSTDFGVGWDPKSGRRKVWHHRKHMLDDPPNMIDPINYVLLFSSIHLFKSFHVVMWSILGSWCPRWYTSIFDGLVRQLLGSQHWYPLCRFHDHLDRTLSRLLSSHCPRLHGGQRLQGRQDEANSDVHWTCCP